MSKRNSVWLSQISLSCLLFLSELTILGTPRKGEHYQVLNFSLFVFCSPLRNCNAVRSQTQPPTNLPSGAMSRRAPFLAFQ